MSAAHGLVLRIAFTIVVVVLPAAATVASDQSAEPPDPEAAPPVLEEPEGPLSLDDAMALALMHSPDLQGFSWDVRASEARLLSARAIPNPELELRFYRLDAPEPDDEDSRRRVIVSQELELGGQRGRRSDVARSETDLARRDFELARFAVMSEVSSAFAEVLGAQRRVEAWKAMVLFARETQQAAEERVASGSARRVEAHEVVRHLGLARIELAQAEAELATARFALAKNWGSLEPRFSEALGQLEDLPPMPDYGAVLSRVQSAPGVARAEAEIQVGQAAVDLAKSERVPNLTIGAGVRWDEEFAEKDYLLDLEIPLPIFDRKKGEVLEARYALARAQSQRRAAAAESARSVAELYHALAESDARRAAFEQEILPAARAIFEAYRIGFANESESLDNLLDARRDVAEAEADHAEALADCHRARAALESVLGGSLD